MRRIQFFCEVIRVYLLRQIMSNDESFRAKYLEKIQRCKWASLQFGRLCCHERARYGVCKSTFPHYYCRRIGRFASQGDVVILNDFWTVARNS